jgi:hypothetical protein
MKLSPLDPGASFTICNLRISEYSESAVFANTCDFFTTGGIGGGMSYDGDDTIQLMKGAVLIDTIGVMGGPTHCGGSANTCEQQACVKTAPGAWVNGNHAPGATAWTCGLSKDVDPRTLPAFIAAVPAFTPTCDCSVHCSIISNHVIVTHDTSSDHSHHKCYKNGSGCDCECFSSAAELAANL